MIFRKLFPLLIAACGVFGQPPPPLINLPAAALERVPVSIQDTRLFANPIDTRPSVMPKKPANPVEPPDFVTASNDLKAGGLIPAVRLAEHAAWPAVGATGWYPPDPDLAVGMNHIVVTVNSTIAIFTKSGTKQFQQTAFNFFSGLVEGTYIFDPKCFYDRIHDRFVLVFLEQSDSTLTSKVLLAVSDDGDPNGTWYRYRLEAKLVINSTPYWFDYPGFGYNKDAYVVTGNMFGFVNGWAGVQFIIIRSADVLAGQPAQTVRLRDESGASVQMAEVIDGANPYVFGVSRYGSSAMRLYAVMSPETASPAITYKDVAVPSNSGPSGDSPSTNGQYLDTLDGRVYNAVWRGHRLVAAHNSTSGNNVVRWYEFDTGTWPASGVPSLVQAGMVSSPNLHYFMPAINRNAAGDIAMLFTGSSTSVTANVMMTARVASDPNGTMGTPSVLQTSEGSTYTQGRWGDFFGVDVDPADDETFYGVGEWIASTNGWATSVYTWTVSGGGGLLAAPSGLTAAAVSSSQINLAWTDNANNETGFKIERSTDNITFTQIATVGADVETYSNTGLTVGTTYYYRVRAYNDDGDSAYSNTASATPGALPAAPSGLTATAASTTRINLAWTDNSSNETGFKIERSTDNIAFTQIGTAAANATSYPNSGLSPGTTYYYRVRAYNAAGNSAYSNTANATTHAIPAAPTELKATAVSSSRIDLAWTDNANNETGFKIERSKDNITFSQFTTVGANVTSYSNTGLSAGTMYYYRVRSYNSAGNSAYSNTASATTLSAGVPAAPSGLTATAVSSSQINLSWTDNASNETGFRIERSPDNVTFAEIGTVGANVTAYSNPGLASSTTYFYRVRAYNASGNSAYSNTANATTSSGGVPAAPSGLTATAVSSSQISLAWTDNSSNETGFKIERSTDNVAFTQIAAVGANTTAYSNTGLGPGTTYYYRVRAYNASGDSAYSNTASATTATAGVPAAPSGLTATAVSTTRINLAWTDNSDNETGFKIERSTDNVIFTQIGTAGANATSYPNAGLASGTTYYYRVRAYNGAGNSAYSNTASATTWSLPAAPTALTATAVSSSRIDLAWTDNSSNETGFKIERSRDSVLFSQITAVGANVTSYSSTGLGSGLTYYYRVRSYNAAGNSAYSNIASTTTPAEPQASPSDSNIP